MLTIVFRKVTGSAVRNVTSDVGSDSALLFGVRWPGEDARRSITAIAVILCIFDAEKFRGQECPRYTS